MKSIIIILLILNVIPHINKIAEFNLRIFIENLLIPSKTRELFKLT